MNYAQQRRQSMPKHIAEQFNLFPEREFEIGIGSEFGVRNIKKIQAIDIEVAKKIYEYMLSQEGDVIRSYETLTEVVDK